MARPIEQAQNARSRSTRRALLEATRQILEEIGYDGLTMSAVADRAGVSRRAIYLHFASRADLINALYGHLAETEALAESLQKVWASTDALSALDEWARHIARAHPRILAISRAHDRARRSDSDAANYWQFAMDNWIKGCRRLMIWLDEEGHLAPPWSVETAADMMYGLMSFDLLERMTSDRGWTPERYAERMALLFRSTFVSPASRD